MKRILALTSVIIPFVVTVVVNQSVCAQQLDWVMLGGGQTYDRAWKVAVDGGSHVYAVGGFTASATFDGHNVNSQGGIDVFVAKASSNGSIEWVRSAGGIQDDEARAVAVGPDGDVYVTGFFAGTAQFGSTTLNSVGGRDIFLAKYSPDGTVIWARSAGGPETPGSGFEDEYGSAVDVSSSGDVYLTGLFRGTATFDGQQITSSGGQDIFVAKYDDNGSLLWVGRAGGTHFQSDEGNGIVAVSDGGAVVTGFFGGSVQFGAHSLVSAGGWDIFVAKYDPDGIVDWASRAGGTGADRGLGIDRDPDGNLYLTGYFSNTAHFDGVSVTASGVRDMFVARMNPLGDFTWVEQTSSQQRAAGQSIAVAPGGLVLASGQFMTSILHPEELHSLGARDVLVVAFDLEGQEMWARSFGGPVDDWGIGIAVHGADAYVAGSVGRDALFGDTDPIQYGGDDAFVVNLSFGEAPVCDDAVASPEMIWPPNHKMVDIAVVGVTDPDGDEVVVAIDGITQDEPVDTRGDGAFLPDGAIASPLASVRAERMARKGNGRVYEISFTASDASGAECTGSVFVCVPLNKKRGGSCVDDGQNYNSLEDGSLSKAEVPSDISLSAYPNPFNPSTHVVFALSKPQHVRVDVVDVMGRRVATLVDGSLDSGRQLVRFDAAALPGGSYIVRLVSENGVRFTHLVYAP